MSRVALFVFNPDPMCAVHVLLNALDMRARGMEAAIVIEGGATRLPVELGQPEHPLHTLWEKVKGAGLVAGVCRACAQKTGSLEAVAAQGLALLDEMSGHPSMARFRQDGFEVLIFG